MTQQETILHFLKAQMLGVVSTVDQNGNPESALVGFAQTDSLELIFGTLLTTRKFANVQNNPRVAFVIGWGPITLQYEGLATILSDSTADEARDALLAKNPHVKKFVFDEQERFIKVTPRFLRYTDVSKKPEEIFELKF